MTTPREVHVQEVGPRDGLQIEPVFVDTKGKIALIDALSQTGVSKIEVSSFVSPKAVPMLADAGAVFAGIRRNPAITYVALVPNLKGARAAIEAQADEINLVMSASQTHNLANMRMTRSASLDAFREIVSTVKKTDVAINGSIATAFGCPFEGQQPMNEVLDLAREYLAIGIRSITLADTTGMANPGQVATMVEMFTAQFPGIELTLHFHDTRGMGLANVLAAYKAGAHRFDSSIGGLGGCPFAPGATGNICSEDLVHMLEEMRIETGVNLDALLDAGSMLPELVGHAGAGKIARAGKSSRRFKVPDIVTALTAA